MFLREKRIACATLRRRVTDARLDLGADLNAEVWLVDQRLERPHTHVGDQAVFSFALAWAPRQRQTSAEVPREFEPNGPVPASHP